jgi:hypothetical protein
VGNDFESLGFGMGMGMGRHMFGVFFVMDGTGDKKGWDIPVS